MLYTVCIRYEVRQGARLVQRGTHGATTIAGGPAMTPTPHGPAEVGA